MWILSLRNTASQQVKKKIYEQISKTHYLSCLLLASLRSISSSSSSSVSAVSSSQIQNPSSCFVVSYLINSGGLSEKEALSASKKIHFKTTSKPDSVLNLLETYGFTKSYISKLITKRPSILSSEPEIAIKPTIDFFNAKGLSGIELAKFICSNPRVLSKSLTTQIIPAFDILKTIVRCDENVVTILRRHSRVLRNKQDIKNMMLNIELLGDEGVPQSNVIKFLMHFPRALMISTCRFKEIVEEIKGLEFDPYKTTYLLAIQVMAGLSKSNWESRMGVYRRLGWSEEEIHKAFTIHPHCMTSDKKITSIMDYLVNQMGYSSSYIAQNPSIFCYSLEKRIVPRCSVIKILTSKGLVKNQIPLTSLLVYSDKSFLEKFVTKFEVEAPELLKLYSSAVNLELPSSTSEEC